MGRVELAGALVLGAVLGLGVDDLRAQRAFEVGVHGGAVASKVHANYRCPPDARACATGASAHEYRRGAAAGLFARTRVWSVVGLQAEVVYAQKGFETTQPTIHADYLELPLLLRLDSAPVIRSALSFHAVAGLAPTLRARCQVFANTATGFRREPCDDRDYFDDENSPARLEVGVVRGLGAALSALGLTVSVQRRLVTSMTDIGVWGGDPSWNRATYTLFGLSYGIAGSR